MSLINCGLYSQGYKLSDFCAEEDLAGISEWYFANWSGTTSWSADADNIITGTSLAPTVWYKVEQSQEQGAYTEEGAQSDNGKNVWTINTEVVFFNNTAKVRDLVRVMTVSRTVLMGKRNDGRIMLIGEKSGLKYVNNSAGSGKAMEDFNGNRVNLTTKQGFQVRQVSETLFGTFNIV